MQTIRMALGLMTSLALAGGQPTGTQPVPIVIDAASVAWVDADPLPPGAQVAALEGEPGTPGPFTLRLRLPGGYTIPAHVHGDWEHVTVLSGTVELAVGGAAPVTLGAGSFFALPSGTVHALRTLEPAVLQVSGTGPWQVHYEEPLQAPRR